MRALAYVLLATSLACASGESSSDWPEIKQWVRDSFPDVPVVTVDELHAELASDPPVLLDARAPEEYAVSHLDGARLAPTLDDAERALEGVPRDAPIVVYCSVGYRSGLLARELREHGYSGAKNLEGSIFEWANRGFPVVRDGHEVHEVHPYDAEWGRLLDPELRAHER